MSRLRSTAHLSLRPSNILASSERAYRDELPVGCDEALGFRNQHLVFATLGHVRMDFPRKLMKKEIFHGSVIAGGREFTISNIILSEVMHVEWAQEW